MCIYRVINYVCPSCGLGHCLGPRWGLVCNTLSLEWLTYDVLFSEVGSLGCYVLSLDQLFHLIIAFTGLCVGGLGRAILLVCLGAVHN